ncbi:MAG: transposase family protein [Bacteroidetes bacterium]|nr:transposase family protein [Bacteroidota bacterium]
MKITYAAIAKKRQLKSVTGLHENEFEKLLSSFKDCWYDYISKHTFEGANRTRERSRRSNSTFQCDEDMLVFILYHYRHYITQELMSVHFEMTQPQVAKWIKALEPILKRCLTELGLMPKREAKELNEQLDYRITIVMDGSERPINRPMDEQEEYYSGKKNDTQ